MTASPFEAFSLIAAPALLTNATCVLAMATVNRMLRTRDRMHELYLDAQRKGANEELPDLGQVQRVERQAILLLQALAAIYVALGAFALGTLMTLVGGTLSVLLDAALMQRVLVMIGIGLVFVGVGGLVFGSIRLFQATQSSIVSLQIEAERIRAKRTNA